MRSTRPGMTRGPLALLMNLKVRETACRSPIFARIQHCQDHGFPPPMICAIYLHSIETAYLLANIRVR
jgi:hypothetical protein